MLAKGATPSSSIREDPYTTTLHRRLAVPPAFVLPPPGAPPSCPLHGATSPRRGAPQRHLPGESSFYPRGVSTFKPAPTDHIYEEPKFTRRHSDGEDPFYHELDPSYNSRIPSDHESDPECDLDSPVAPPCEWITVAPGGGYRPLAPPGEFTYMGQQVVYPDILEDDQV